MSYTVSKEEFESLKKNVEDVHTAVCGNAELGVDGLVQQQRRARARLDNIESTQRKGILWASVIGGVFAGAFLGIKKVAELIAEHI